MVISSRLLQQIDKANNVLYLRIFSDENKVDVYSSIHLKLASEKHQRMLGHIDIANKTFYCKRDMTKHYHYKSGGFGFNWGILEDAYLDIDTINLLVFDKSDAKNETKNRYVFPKSLIGNFGKVMNFKQQGFELQRFLKYELIKNYKKTDEL